MNFIKYLGLSLTVISGALLLSGNTVYQWTDENGVVHFSQMAPEDKSQTVEETSIRSAAMTGGTFAPPAVEPAESSEPNESTDPTQAEQAQVTPTPTRDPQACSQAREMLATLDTGRRLRLRDPDTDELTYATDDDLAEQRRRANAAIEKNCL